MAKSQYVNLSGAPIPDSYGWPTISSLVDPTPTMPITSGLVGLYVLNAQAGRLKNYANPNLPLVQAGSPTFGPNYALLNNSNYLRTGFVPTGDWSFVMICEPTVAGSPNLRENLFINNFDSLNTTVGDSIGFGPSTRLFASGATVADPTVKVIKSITIGVSSFVGNEAIGGVFSSNAGIRYLAGDAGTFAKSDVLWSSGTAAQRTAPPALELYLGAVRNATSWPGTAKISAVALYNRALSDADMEACLRYFRYTWAPSVGVPIRVPA